MLSAKIANIQPYPYSPVFGASILKAYSNIEKPIHTLGIDGISSRKSSIEITYPNKNTVWTIPEPVKIEWRTSNIDENKSIRFFLTKDNMVVQELGTFKNTFTASGIHLAKNIAEGDTYQVVGIELFPDDNYQIAKFATPYFSIRNNVVRSSRRMEFDGRKISYVKELVFDSDEISIGIWDHGRQDDDIVSIYLNGYTIISKYHLTYHKKQIDLKLDPKKPNDLFLYAHNLGKFPPNTVSLEITDGTTSENIVLNSDLKSCEAILIKVRK